MSSTDIARQEGGAYAALVKAENATERYEAGQYAMELTDVPGFTHPVPRFFFDLPWADDDETTVESILVNLAAADDIEKATSQEKLRKLDDIIGQPVTILDIRAQQSDLEDAKWGAYIMLALSVDGGAQEAISTGHGQVCVTLWRCFCEGRLPVSGVFKKLGTPTKGRNQPIGFQVESAL